MKPFPLQLGPFIHHTKDYRFSLLDILQRSEVKLAVLISDILSFPLLLLDCTDVYFTLM